MAEKAEMEKGRQGEKGWSGSCLCVREQVHLEKRTLGLFWRRAREPPPWAAITGPPAHGRTGTPTPAIISANSFPFPTAYAILKLPMVTRLARVCSSQRQKLARERASKHHEGLHPAFLQKPSLCRTTWTSGAGAELMEWSKDSVWLNLRANKLGKLKLPNNDVTKKLTEKAK